MAFKQCSSLLADLIQAGAEKRWKMEYKGIVNTGDTFGGRAVGPAAWQSKDKAFVLLMFREDAVCEYDLLQTDPESTVEMVDFMGSYGHAPDELLEATRVAFTANAAYAAPPPDTTPWEIFYAVAGHCDAEGGGGAFEAASANPEGQLIVLGRTEAAGLLRSVVFFENVQLPKKPVASARLKFTADGGEALVRDLMTVTEWTGSDYVALGEWENGMWKISEAGIDLNGLAPQLVLDGVTHFRISVDPVGNGGGGIWITVNDTGGQPVGSLFTEDPITAPATFLVECSPIGEGRILGHVNISFNSAETHSWCTDLKAVARTAGKTEDPLVAHIGITPNPAVPTGQSQRAAILAGQRAMRTHWDLTQAWAPGAAVQSPNFAPMLNALLTDNAYEPGRNLAVVIESRFPGKTAVNIDRRCRAGSDIVLKIN